MYEVTLHLTAVTDYLVHGVPPSVERNLGAIGRAHHQRAAWQSADPVCLWPRVQRGDPDVLTMAASLALEGHPRNDRTRRPGWRPVTAGTLVLRAAAPLTSRSREMLWVGGIDA